LQLANPLKSLSEALADSSPRALAAQRGASARTWQLARVLFPSPTLASKTSACPQRFLTRARPVRAPSPLPTSVEVLRKNLPRSTTFTSASNPCGSSFVPARDISRCEKIPSLASLSWISSEHFKISGSVRSRPAARRGLNSSDKNSGRV